MDSTPIRKSLSVLATALPRDGVVVYVRSSGGDRSIRYAVGALEAVTGVAPAVLNADPSVWSDLLHPEDGEEVRARIGALEPGDEVVLDYRIRTPAGGERWVRDAMRYTETPGDDAGCIVGLLADRSLEHSLRAQVAALEARMWESQRMESLGALSGGVAHDFNNLLTTILNTVQLMEEDGAGLPLQARRDLRLIRETAERGGGMVRQILNFARRRGYASEQVDVNDIVEGLEAILARRLGVGVELDVHCDTVLSPVVADTAQLEQVVLNLVVNAREAMPEGGSIVLRTREVRLQEPLEVEGETLEPGAYVRVSVEDRGEGIPDTVRGSIFDPFFSTKTGSGGSGLGLSTVHRIVRGHGGGIRVETEPGVGTVFHVYLPVREADGLPVEVRAARLPDSGKGLRCLVVEDDPAVRQLVTRILAKEGHAVVNATSVAEAIRAFDQAKPRFQVVIVDVVLTDRRGTELVTALRRRADDLGVVYVSAYSEELSAARGASRGGEVYLEKPFTARALKEAVDRARRAAAGEPAPDDAQRGATGS